MLGVIIVLSSLVGIVGFIIFLRIYLNKVHKRNINTTKCISKLYKNILAMNKKYKFNKIDSEVVEFLPALRSKRSLDNFIINDYVMDELEERMNYFTKAIKEAEENRELYKAYLKDYAKIEKYTTVEEFQTFENVRMSYKTFIKIEKILYNQNKISQPIVDIKIHCHPTYTSPSGRNHYYKDAIYSHEQIKRLIKLIGERVKEREKERLIKEEKNRTKREKEKKLRELDKLEKRLKEKEEALNTKEKEFLDATRDQMYSTDIIQIANIEEENNDKELTLSQKLKALKTQFENGKITYAEYQEKRKELI